MPFMLLFQARTLTYIIEALTDIRLEMLLDEIWTSKTQILAVIQSYRLYIHYTRWI